jgi:CRP-like cAMP-binding protein
MVSGALGKVYRDGEIVFRQGEEGDCMYVVQEGKVEVLSEQGDKKVRLTILEKGDSFGEMAIVGREIRSATVRALGEARLLTVDKKTFLRRIHEDPSIAYRIILGMSKRIRALGDELAQLKVHS